MFELIYSDPQLLFPGLSPSQTFLFELLVTIFQLTTTVVIVVAEWKLFKKIGEKPWKSLIPIYNIYIVYKYAWKPSRFWIYIAASFCFDTLFGFSERLSEVNPESIWITGFILIAFPFGVVVMITSILFSLRIAEAFGKKTAFGLGIVFMYSLFIAIIGFGKAKYIGNSEFSDKKDTVAASVSEEVH